MLHRPVENREGLRFLFYLQVNSFIDAARRHEAPGSETRDFFLHSK